LRYRETLRADRWVLIALLAVAYTLISALVIYNVEPESFDNFFEAIYWATVSLTTVGYGDIYPVTTIGRIVTMVSSVFGIAIIALPSGVITAGYLSEINNDKETVEQTEEESQEKV
jgi:voltage-gated potassium channel